MKLERHDSRVGHATPKIKGRLVQLTDRASTPNTKAEYRYNGLGQRVAYKLNGTGTWYDLVQDEQWREVAVYDRTNNKLLERTLYHNAGLNGRGGSSYIDSAAIRGTNPSTPSGSYPPVMQDTWYVLQNWRADVVATLASDGTHSAWSSYTAYGKQQIWGVADVDDGSGNGVPDGGVTIDDFLMYDAWFQNGDPQADVDDGSGKGIPDGGVTIDDYIFYLDWYGGTGGDFNSRTGYAGYVKDEADSAQSGLYHVRYRVYSTELGSWLTQDPLGYVDGASLYNYANSQSMKFLDPMGLWPWTTPLVPTVPSSEVPVQLEPTGHPGRYSPGAYWPVPGNNTTPSKVWKSTGGANVFSLIDLFIEWREQWWLPRYKSNRTAEALAGGMFACSLSGRYGYVRWDDGFNFSVGCAASACDAMRELTKLANSTQDGADRYDDRGHFIRFWDLQAERSAACPGFNPDKFEKFANSMYLDQLESVREDCRAERFAGR